MGGTSWKHCLVCIQAVETFAKGYLTKYWKYLGRSTYCLWNIHSCLDVCTLDVQRILDIISLQACKYFGILQPLINTIKNTQYMMPEEPVRMREFRGRESCSPNRLICIRFRLGDPDRARGVPRIPGWLEEPEHYRPTILNLLVDNECERSSTGGRTCS